MDLKKIWINKIWIPYGNTKTCLIGGKIQQTFSLFLFLFACSVYLKVGLIL